MLGSKGWLVVVVLLLMATAGSSLTAQSSSEEENKAMVAAFFELEAARQFEEMRSMFADDFVRYSVATTAVMPDVQVTSRNEYISFLRSTMAMFPDYYNTPQMLVAEGDYVAFYSIFTGTSAETGNQIELPITGLVRFEDRKIVEMWVEWDNLTWNSQMMVALAETNETPISSMADIVGMWRIYMEEWAGFMEVTTEGWSYQGHRGCGPDSCLDRDEFVLEGSQIHYLTSTYQPNCGDARYNVFVVKRDDQRVGLRFELDGEDCLLERRTMLNGKIIPLVKP